MNDDIKNILEDLDLETDEDIKPLIAQSATDIEDQIDEIILASCKSPYLTPSRFYSYFSVANRDTILSWSCGAVKNTETINYRKFTPEIGGLGCPKIFGPFKSFQCLCGRYKGKKYEGIVCGKCEVLVASSRIRRYRMGHIELHMPVVHPWFKHSVCALLLKLPKTLFDSINNYTTFIAVKDNIAKGVKKMHTIPASLYYKDHTEDADCWKSGGEAILDLLSQVDLLKLLKETQKANVKNLKIRRLCTFLLKTRTKPTDFVIDCLPVLPAALRPVVLVENNKFITSGLNMQYKTVITRKRRFLKFQSIGAPELVCNNERNMTAKAVEALLAPKKSSDKKVTTKSIGDILKGKKGRLKSVRTRNKDYSARSIITPDATLSLDQCGIPKRIAMELFSPYIYHYLQRKGKAVSLVMAKKIVDAKSPEAYEALEEVIKKHPIILNRAPTLHRLGVQGFDIRIVEGDAIRVHPLVCAPFNADHDGDNMSAHLPMGVESREECRRLMFPKQNVLMVSNGQPALGITKDITLGIYYLTLANDTFVEGLFYSFVEVEFAFQLKHIRQNDNIKYRMCCKAGTSVVTTTYGRLKVWYAIKFRDLLDFNDLNRTLNKDNISEIILDVFSHVTSEDLKDFLDAIKIIGFASAKESGVSIGCVDAVVAPERAVILANTQQEINEIERKFKLGFINKKEKLNREINAWIRATDSIEYHTVLAINEDKRFVDSNGIWTNNLELMMKSKARGSRTQLRQFCGIKGAVTKYSGVVDTVVKQDYLGGIKDMIDYSSTTAGSRKGLIDVVTNTAAAGYFSKRLIDASHACIISHDDCGTEECVEIDFQFDERKFGYSPFEHAMFHTAAKTITDKHNKTIVEKGQGITREHIKIIKRENILKIHVRSAVLCEIAGPGVCAKCYGLDPSRNKLGAIGLACGVIASQSLGEPVTQLTMRTFHFGGVARTEVESPIKLAQNSGFIVFKDFSCSLNSNNENICLMRGFLQICLEGKVLSEIAVKPADHILVTDGAFVNAKDQILKREVNFALTISVVEGFIKFSEIEEGVNARKHTDEFGQEVLVIETTKRLKPRIQIQSAGDSSIYYSIPHGAYVVCRQDGFVRRGDVLFKTTNKEVKTQDISTEGLPKIVRNFENRAPLVKATLAESEGFMFVEYGTLINNIIIRDTQGAVLSTTAISSSLNLILSDGSYVRKGDQLTAGEIWVKDLFTIFGLGSTFIKSFIGLIQQIYCGQGLSVSALHIEVILRQMTRKSLIVAMPEYTALVGTYIDRHKVKEIQKLLAQKDLPEITVEPTIMGIARVAAESDSPWVVVSFQKTIQAIADAAVSQKKDLLSGINENVSLCLTINCGTGIFDKKTDYDIKLEHLP